MSNTCLASALAISSSAYERHCFVSVVKSSVDRFGAASSNVSSSRTNRRTRPFTAAASVSTFGAVIVPSASASALAGWRATSRAVRTNALAACLPNDVRCATHDDAANAPSIAQACRASHSAVSRTISACSRSAAAINSMRYSERAASDHPDRSALADRSIASRMSAIGSISGAKSPTNMCSSLTTRSRICNSVRHFYTSWECSRHTRRERGLGKQIAPAGHHGPAVNGDRTPSSDVVTTRHPVGR